MTDHGGGAGAGGQRTPDPDTVREEAERLVVTGLAAMSMVADRIGAPTRERGGSVAAGYDALGNVLFGPAGHRRHSVANESPECCRCPLCRMISAARQPSPVVAERLATGVGTMAEGAARVLRGLAGAAGSLRDTRPRPGGEPSGGGPAGGGPSGGGPSPAPEPPRPEPSPPRPTGPQPPRPGAAPDRDTDPWAAATASPAAAPSVPTAAPAPVEPPAATPPPATPPVVETGVDGTVAKKPVAKKPVAKKAVVKKAVAKKAVAEKAVAKKPVAKKAVAKKVVAKKAAAKKTVANESADQKTAGEAGQ